MLATPLPKSSVAGAQFQALKPSSLRIACAGLLRSDAKLQMRQGLELCFGDCNSNTVMRFSGE